MQYRELTPNELLELTAYPSSFHLFCIPLRSSKKVAGYTAAAQHGVRRLE